MQLRRDGYGVTAWTLPRRGRAALALCAARGLRHIHIGSEDAALDDAAEFAAHAADLGIEVAGYGVRELERVGIHDMDRAIAVLDAALSTANELKVPLIYLPSFGASEIRDSSSLERTARLISHCLGATDAIVATENTLDAELNRTLFSFVGDPRARLLFDTQNPCLAGLDPVALVHDLGDLFAPTVHVKDGVDGGEGNAAIAQGAAGVSATLEALRVVGYLGGFTLETDYRSLGMDRVSADIAALDTLVPA